MEKVWFSLAILIVMSCGKKSKNDAPSAPAAALSMPNLSEMFVHLPTALSPQGLSLADAEDSYKGILLSMRPLVGVADALIQGAIQQVFTIFGKPQCFVENLSENCEGFKGLSGMPGLSAAPAVFLTSEAVRSAGGPYVLRYYLNGEGSAFSVTYQMYWKSSVDSLYRKGIQVEVTRADLHSGEGKMWLWPRNMGRGGATNPEFLSILFQSTPAQKQMSVQMLNGNMASTSGLPQRLSYSVTGSADGSFSGFGAAVRGILASVPTVMQDKPLPFASVDPMATVFRFLGNTNSNRVVLDLSLLNQGEFAGTDIYKSQSVAVAMKQHVILSLRNGTSCATDGTILGLPANICATQTQVGDNLVWASAASYCATNPSASMCLNVVTPAWIWQNPIYLAASGFKGTAVYNVPASGYEGLVVPLSDLPQASALALWNAVVEGEGEIAEVN